MKTMICLGDSLTEGADIPVGHTWPALVSNALNLEVINYGIGGDTTQGMLSRFYPEVAAKKPAFAFIMGGTNDLWWGVEVNIILANIFSIVVQARHHGIAPVIGLPLPVDADAARRNDFSPPWEGYEKLVEKMDELVEKLILHAKDSEVAVIDLHGPFLIDRRVARQDLFLPDGLHPNRTGHLCISRAIVSGFREQFNFTLTCQ